MERGLFHNIDQVYFYIDSLKKTKPKLMTNCYLGREKMENAIASGGIFYEFEKDRYLNLFCADDGFSRLYFYIVDETGYKCCSNSMKKACVCDIFVTHEDAAFFKIKDSLQRCNFLPYACYGKWEADSAKGFSENSVNPYVFRYDKNMNVIEHLFDIFDKYTDYLPRKCELESFLKEKSFVSLYDASTNMLAGGLVFTEKPRMCETDFIFTLPEARGKKAGSFLYNHFFQKYFKTGHKYVAWIDINNQSSIALHEKFNYKRKDLRKYTFLNTNYDYLNNNAE